MSVTDAPTARVAPPTGWYPDPTGAGGTRFWDGSGWTDRTRSSEPNPPPAFAAPPAAAKAPASPTVVPLPAPASRPRNWVAFLVVIAIVLFAAAGALHVAGGTGGGSGDPNRFSGDNAQAAPDSIPSTNRDGPCTGTNHPSAAAIVGLLADRGQPITVANPPPPAGAPAPTTPPATTANGMPADPLCSRASFDDPRGGRGTVYAFVSSTEADRALAAGIVGPGGVPVKAGHIVVVLSQPLAGQLAAYQSALDSLPAMVRR